MTYTGFCYVHAQLELDSWEELSCTAESVVVTVDCRRHGERATHVTATDV